MPQLEQRAEDLEEALYTLDRSTARLRLFSVQVLLATVLNFGITLAVTVIGSSVGHYLTTPGAIALVILPIVGFVTSIGALAMYDQARRRGNALFDELSDEMEWHLGGTSTKRPLRDPPVLRARLLLREYVASTDLWFVPGRLGPGVYALTNLSICFVAVWTVAANWPNY